LFDPRAIHVECGADEMTLGQVFLWICRFHTVSYHTSVPCVSMAELFSPCFNTTVCPFEFPDGYYLLFFFTCV